MSLSPKVCKKNYKVHIPAMGEECEFWLVRVTDEGSITNPDKDHAYYTDDGKLFIYDGKNLVRVNCDICFTQDERDKLEGIEEGANKYVLPVAKDSSLGGIKTGFTQTEKQYAVEVTEEGQAYVTVPWTDTVYTLPVADTDTLGGVKLGYSQNGKNYPVLKDSEGNIYVAVPWEEYSLPQAETDTLGGIKTGYEQQGQNYPVDVDVEGNAYVTVPWSETGYQPATDTTLGLIETGYQSNGDNYAVDLDENGKAFAVVPLDSTVINGKQFVGSSYAGETSDCGVELKKIVGKTVQNGTPSPDSPVEIEDVKITEITSHGRQLINPDYYQDVYGITVTKNDDGSITLNGTATGNADVLKLGARDSSDVILDGTTKWKADVNNSNLLIIGVNGTSQEFSEELSINENSYTGELTYFLLRVKQGTTLNNFTFKFMLYQEGDGTFEPFHENTVETNLTLAEGDTYENGQITRKRKQITFDGSSDEEWRAINNNRFQITVQGVASNGYSTPKGVCNRLQPMSLSDMGTTAEWGIISCHNGSIYIRVSESVTTVEQLQTWLSTHNVIVEYELETPTVEDFNIPTIPSYEDYTYISTDSEVEPTITFRPLPFTECKLQELYEWYQKVIQGSATVLIKRS